MQRQVWSGLGGDARTHTRADADTHSCMSQPSSTSPRRKKSSQHPQLVRACYAEGTPHRERAGLLLPLPAFC